LSSELRHRVMPTKHFERQLRSLDRDARERALSKIIELANGEMQGKALRGPRRGFYTIRVGKYRIIYKVLKPCEIELYTIGHREAVYERLD